jgi:hypothetical protein
MQSNILFCKSSFPPPNAAANNYNCLCGSFLAPTSFFMEIKAATLQQLRITEVAYELIKEKMS